MGRQELSPEEIRYSTEGQDTALGTAYPAWHWALLIPNRSFRKGINLENGNEFQQETIKVFKSSLVSNNF